MLRRLRSAKRMKKLFFRVLLERKLFHYVVIPKGVPKVVFHIDMAKKNQVEMTYNATIKNTNKFYASAEPARPNALFSEVWFDKDEYRYLIGSCIGGNCNIKAGLLVYKNNKIISKKICEKYSYGQEELGFGEVDFNGKISNNPSIEFNEVYPDINPLIMYKKK